jgi:hypothetical protein
MAIKVVNSARDLSQTDRWAFMNLLSWGQRAILATAPFMEQKLLDDLLKAARAGNNPAVVTWLAEHGYRVSTTEEAAAVGADNTEISNTPTENNWSIYSEGDEVTFTYNGQSIKRYFYNDPYGNILLAQNADGSNTDFVIKDNQPTYVMRDSNGVWYNPDTNKQFTAYNRQWTDYTPATDPFANLTDTGTVSPVDQANIENTQADTAYRNALTQQLLADINSPTTTETQKNDAAIQLYGILTSYANQNNQNAVSQWGNQAGAFNTAYQNAIEQNKWLQDMSTSPLNTVAYLNLIRGQNPPNWNLPNYQQMPDAFTGWQQQQPTNQPAPDAATVLALMQQLWGQGKTTPNQYVTPNGQTHPVTEPITNWSTVVTPEQLAPAGQTWNGSQYVPTTPPPTLSGANYGNQTWTQQPSGNYLSYAPGSAATGTTPRSPTTLTESYGTPNTVNDTLAALRAANPGVNYSIGADGMIKVG